MNEDFKPNLRGEIRSLAPYEMEDEPARIKLDANESPLDVPAEIKDEILRVARSIAFNRYPDPQARALRELLAETQGVTPDMVLMGNGSDEILQMVVAAFGGPGTRGLFPVPTFAIYRILVQVAGMTPIFLPLRPDTFALPPEIVEEAAHEKTAVTFLATPNNPTGNCFDAGMVERVLQAGRGMVVADEAYFEFSGKTFLPAIKKHPNLLVLRTFSKAYSLAGLRTGYVIGCPEAISVLAKVKMPYNLNAFSQAAAFVVLKHRRIFGTRVRQILQDRDALQVSLAKVPGIRVYPTEANFILFRTEKDSGGVFSRLREQGILIRNLGSQSGLDNCLRANTGTSAENREFLDALERIMTS